MHLIKNKNGIGIAAVIGIVTFVLALTTTLFGVTVNQAIMIKKSTENAELVANNTHDLNSAIEIIENDPTILDDSIKRAALSNLLNITFNQTLGSDYWQLTNNDLEQTLTSYVKFIPSGSVIGFDELMIDALNFNDLAIGEISIPTDFYVQAASAFYNEFVFANDGINPGTNSFSGIINDSNRTNVNKCPPSCNYSSLPSNKILVVDGDFTINRFTSFNGIVIASGNISIKRRATVNGALYAGGSVTTENNINFATSRDTFIFANSFTFGSGRTSQGIYNLYSFTNFLTINSTYNFIGGFFTDNPADIALRKDVTFESLTTPLTLADGTPLNLFIEISGSGGSLGDGQLISSYPRKE